MQKQDIALIGNITGSDEIHRLLDQIFDAAKEVRIAHVKAGRYLSSQLKKKIGSILQEHGDIDPFNIWKPIETVLENLGNVRILKVIDIGSEVVVNIADTNRLIEEGGK